MTRMPCLDQGLFRFPRKWVDKALTDQSVILDQAAGGQPTARLELIRQQLENEGYTDVTEEELRTLLPRFPEFFPELSPESAR